MNIHYSRKAAKDISKLDTITKKRIKQGIERIPQGDIKPLKGVSGLSRLRVGDWRITFSYSNNDTILIERIAPRGEIYKGV